MNRYKFIDEGRQHLHTLDGKPLHGASTVSKIISSGNQLQWWASSKAVETLGWIKKEYAADDKYKKNCLNEQDRINNAFRIWEKICKMSHASFLNLLDTAYKAHSVRLKGAQKKGIDLHAELEKWVKAQISGEPYDVPLSIKDQLIPFIMWSQKNVKRWLFSEIHVYSETLWTGGIIDAGYISNKDEFVLVDFKSGGVYLNGLIQLGGYALQLTENMGAFDQDGNRIWGDSGTKIPESLAVLSFKGGFKEPTIIRGQTQKYMDAFKHALKLYKLQQEFEHGK